MTQQHDVGRIYDELADGYDRYHTDGKSLAENAHVADVLRGLVRPGLRVADLGCGTGLLLELCPVAAPDYVGLDISEGMLTRARQKFPGHAFHAGDIQAPHAALPDGSVDLVVSLFGSPAYCDAGLVRDQVFRMLKPGGGYFLMFCGPRYPKRSTYISRETSFMKPRRAVDLAALFRGGSVQGMSCAVDLLPGGTPPSVARAVLDLESAILGKLFPDAFFFLNVSGQRPAGQGG
ncbi:MAG: hypothetical protein RL653_108 [Pseudomonadota bacterium]|jgi:ubiquinone/menaquinone biosynthesis C-methylase UbiE